MKLFASLAAMALMAVALSASAQDKPPAPSKPAAKKEGFQCFFTRDIWNYQSTDDERTLYLKVRNNDIYRLDFTNTCFGLSYKQHIAIQSFGGSTICAPIDVELKVSDAGGVAIPCVVDTMHKLTPEEVAALPKKLKP